MQRQPGEMGTKERAWAALRRSRGPVGVKAVPKRAARVGWGESKMSMPSAIETRISAGEPWVVVLV